MTVSSETELIRALLGCGYADIKTMTDVMEMGEDLFADNPIEMVINDHIRDEISFNGILCDAMEYIAYHLVYELDRKENYGEGIYHDILNNYWDGPYVNYMDSSFQIDCLDGWRDGDKDRLLVDLKKELLEMKKKHDR